MTARTLSRNLWLAALLCVVGGCQSLPRCLPFCRPKSADSAAVAPSVDVGGAVTRPGPIAIPAEGLTLQRALALAGQVPQFSLPVAGNANSVSLEEINRYLDDRKQAGELAKTESYVRNGVAVGDAAALSSQNAALTTKKNFFEQTVTPSLSATVQELGDLARSIGQHEYQMRTHAINLKAKAFDEQKQTEAQLMEELQKETEDFTTKLSVLKQALTGGIVASAVQSPSTRLTMLVRRTQGSTETYYFPYDAAITGSAGNILLAAGDLVQVVDFQDAQATSVAGQQASQYAVQGFIDKPGTRSVSGTISIYLALNDDKPNVGGPDAVTTVERGTVTGGTEIYVIPLHAAQSGAMSKFAVRGGDVVTVTTMNLVPIVTHGLVSQALGSNVASNRIVNSSPQHCDKLHDACDRHLEQSIRNGGDVNAQILRNLQDARGTLNARVGDLTPLR